MYIKTYQLMTENSDLRTTSPPKTLNLALSTQEGINLHKFMTPNQKREIPEPLTPGTPAKSKVEPNTQNGKVQAEHNFYQSNRFSISLKNNRLREIRAKNKQKQKFHQKVKEELINIIEKKIGSPNKNIYSRSVSQKWNPKKHNKNIQFETVNKKKDLSISNDPSYQNIVPPSNYPEIGSPTRTFYTRPSSNSHKRIKKIQTTAVVDLSKRDTSHVHNFKIVGQNKDWNNRFLLDSTEPYQQQYDYQNQLYKNWKAQQLKQEDLNSRVTEGTQPQILIDYRRAMSSGRKRSRATKQNNHNPQIQEKKQKKEQLFGQFQKLNPWMVKNMDDDQIIF